MALVPQMINVSATPGDFELRLSQGVVVEQIIRPTGLVDPEVDIRPVRGQVDDLLNEIRVREARQRAGAGHHAHQADVGGPDRLPPAGRACGSATSTPTSTPSSGWRSCAASGWATSTCWSGSTCSARGSTCPRSRWWRSSTPTRRASSGRDRSLVQTIGRAARNVNGRAILYADRITGSMQRALDEMTRRREHPAAPQRGARDHPALDRQVDGGGAALDPRGRRAHRAARAQAGGAGAGGPPRSRRAAPP